MVVGVSCSVVGPKRYERWGVAPTREEGTLHTTDVGEPNPPTGAALSTTISPVPTFEEKDKETKETKGNLK